MGVQSYTHRDIAKALGVSETTIKSYRSKFPTFLPVAREGKPVRLHPESLDVCRRIRDLFADGLSILQTSQQLQSDFKEYPRNRRLSIPSRQAPLASSGVEAASPGADALASRIEALTKAQDMARERMELLELEVRNLATMEAASKSLIAELLGELRAARAKQEQTPEPGLSTAPPAPDRNAARRLAPSPVETPASGIAPAATRKPSSPDADPTVLTARKIVTLHGPAGPVASYALARESRPEPEFPEQQTPAPAFLDLPAVILSERGEFLGLPGGQSVRRLVEVLSPEGAPPPAWFLEAPDSWVCAISFGRAQNREMLFERTTTPRGNLVGLIRRMRINESEATPQQLQELFRQLRDQLA
ncbi:MAG: MerR family transcriptional regulator [Bacteroidales bacterium]